MSNHTQATGRGDGPPPTAKQQRYLRTLAEQRGVSFTPPKTRAEASQAIDELRRRRPDSRADEQRDRRAIRDQLAAAGDDARIRDSEIDGYGSSATWASRS
jgi:GAF domain-containing protein